MDHKIIFPQELSGAVMDAFGGVYRMPQAIPKDETLFGVDGVFSTIYFKGDIVGKVSVFLRGQDAATIISSMLGMEELSPESPETLDGIGEIVNMVAGRFKTRLEPHKINFDISVPSTRMTTTVPPGRWENNLEHFFSVAGSNFRVLLSYRVATKEDQAPVHVPPKLKLSAAELLKAVMAKKK
jgi:CheY-specific phosphatase CheX